MAGGTPAWEEAGLYFFGLDASKVEVDTNGPVALDAGAFNQLVEDEEGAVIVDVRTAEEIESGMIEGAVHIDSQLISSDIEIAVDNLPEDYSTPLLLYCEAGVRSRGAANDLMDYDYQQVYYLDSRPNIDADGNLIE